MEFLDKAWKIYSLIGVGYTGVILWCARLHWNYAQSRKDQVQEKEAAAQENADRKADLEKHQKECNERYKGLHDKITSTSAKIDDCQKSISKVDSGVSQINGFLQGLFQQPPKGPHDPPRPS